MHFPGTIQEVGLLQGELEVGWWLGWYALWGLGPTGAAHTLCGDGEGVLEVAAGFLETLAESLVLAELGQLFVRVEKEDDRFGQSTVEDFLKGNFL